MNGPRSSGLSALAEEQRVRASAQLREWVGSRASLSLREWLLPLRVQARHSRHFWGDSLGFWEEPGRPGEALWLPRYHFQRTPQPKPRMQVGIFAGIHGDEPAGILGLIDFLHDLEAEPWLGQGYELWIYPVCNPGGCIDGTRLSRSGLDLNREFWRGSEQPEVRLLEREIRARRFDGIIALHSDDTSPGFYGYARGNVLARELLVPALEAAEAVQARDGRGFIDGFRAVNGILHDCYDGILSAPPEQKPRPFEIILESPSQTPLEHQRDAFRLALRALLTEYRAFMAYGADL
jgi:protein MpaA